MELQHSLDFDAPLTMTWQEEEVAESIEKEERPAKPSQRVVRMLVSPGQYAKAASPGHSFINNYIRYHTLGTDQSGQRFVVDMEREHIKFSIQVRPTKQPRRVNERDPSKRWS